MATKNHVDNSVAERRLRPIYSWLDEGNNKRALQEAEKVLKKQPNFQCAKVLKGLALLRLGKETECQKLLESIRNEDEFYDSTLQAMTICYREMNKPEEICNIYSIAIKHDPKNEDLLTHLFMAYVRICEYKKQQQTAMALYKVKFKNHYYFWAVMSIVMQAHEAGPELAKSLHLPLAEKMVKKFLDDDNKMDAEQEVQLYLMILEMQDKLAEALTVVESPLGEKLNSFIAVPAKKIELLMKMKCWDRANLEIRKMLVDDMDNWLLYINYFKTVFHIAKLESENVVGDTNSNVIDDCVTFLTDIQKKNESGNHCLRGPYLAIMEFFVQLLDNHMDPEMHFGYFTDLLLVYFKNFGSKTCCLNDLRPYLDRLSESQVSTFLDEIWKFIELEDGQLPTSKEQMLRYISNLHITRYLGYHQKLSVKDKLLLTDCLLRYYVHGAQFNAPSLLPTDIRHNDPFVILIVEIMNDVWLETNEGSYLKNAIVILEYALEKSPSNHQFKVLLIKLYNILGISKGAHNIYEQLDVKHVQLDSLGYLQCWPLISTGQYFLASHLFEITLKFFTLNYKDSADNLTFLYKFGSFLKINEFIEFRERLNNSLHYTAVTVEKMLLGIFLSPNYENTIQLIEQMAITPEKESIQFDKLEDNRDLDLCWTSDPKHRLITNELIKTSFEHDVDLLQIRSLTLRIIAATVQIANAQHGVVSIVNGSNDGHGKEYRPTEKESCKTLEEVSQQLTNLPDLIIQKNYKRLPKNVINAPVESRLFFILELPFINLVETLSSTLLTISSEDPKEIKKLQDKSPVVKLSESISLLHTEVKSSDLSQLGLRCRLLNILTLLVEMGSIACLFCGACFDIVKPQVNHQIKKGKKKKDNPTVHQEGNDNKTVCKNLVKNFISLTVSTLEDLDSCVTYIEDKWRELENSENDLVDSMNMLKLSLTDIGSSQLSATQKIMSDSYKSSLLEIHYVIKLKIKYLSELQL